MHRVDAKKQLLLLPGIRCGHCNTVQTYVFQIIGIQNDTNKSRYDIRKTQIFERVVA